jgi:hypothetical protein
LHYRGCYRNERRIIPLKEDNSAVLCGRNEFPEQAKISQGTVCKFHGPAPSLSTAVQTIDNMASAEAHPFTAVPCLQKETGYSCSTAVQTRDNMASAEAHPFTAVPFRQKETL